MSNAVSQVVEVTLGKKWDHKVPVDIRKIASQCGVVVREGLPGVGFNGCAKQADDGKWVIEYNREDSENRQRFAIANALGHILLGHVSVGKPVFSTVANYTLTGTNQRDANANAFAMGVLMPKLAIKYTIDNSSVKSTDDLAELFKVSGVAMHNQLTKFNKQGWES